MQNSTYTNDSSETLSGTQIVTITLSCCSLLGTLLAIAYVKIKSQFRDRQDSKIELTNEMTKEGTKIITLNKITITYSNDENYFEEAVSMKNGKNKNHESKSLELINDSQIDTILNNNNLGDVIIANTRKSLEQKALNTYIKSISMAQSEKINNSNILKI
ncbi:MAG: hypothetical protein AB8B68_05505 [Rickettsiaceae bacterium]